MYFQHYLGGTSTWSAKKPLSGKNEEALLQFLSILDILEFNDLAAMEYGRICAYFQRQGTPIGTMDMLIAAHAKSEDLVLVTNNLREFERVPQIKLGNWVE